MTALSADVLSRRALNRALLERQLLLRRVEMPAVDVLEHLVGMQAQVPRAPYMALWTRLHGFDPRELSGLIESRQAVRSPLMRSTIHLVTAPDCLMLWPLLQPVLERLFYKGSPFGRRIGDVSIDAVVAAGRAHLEARPRTLAQLRKLLAEEWPGQDAEALAYAVHYLAPFVQVPPRGLWGVGGQATWTTVEAWLGRPVEAAPSLEELVMRYLGAFGPASVSDMQAWSGLTQLREIFERLRPRLRSFRDESAKELLDLPDAPRPNPGVPAPPRFLPEYDNVLLAHADRSRIGSEEQRKWAYAAAGATSPGSLLVDGFFGALWKIRRTASSATLVIQPFAPLSRQDRIAVEEEGARLLNFAAAGAGSHDIQFAAAP